MKITHISPKKGSFEEVFDSIAPDKSISHRAAIFSLLSGSAGRVKNYLQGEDTLHTLKIAQQLGLKVKQEGDWLIFTPPTQGIREPDDLLDCGNAGTAMRLYTGLLAASRGYFVLTGDSYLRGRPMRRVVEPLRSVGAEIYGREDGNFAPLTVRGKKLVGFTYHSPISSAQVKSAMILAALQGDTPSYFSEKEASRDHTEKMLNGMGAKITIGPSARLVIHPLLGQKLDPIEMSIPADPSSAFFFAVAAAITPGARVILKNILLNPTRIEAFEVLRRMGALVAYALTSDRHETLGDIEVAHASLQAVEISEKISWLIDELPALAIAMATAKGTSRVRGASELRVKESDRISAVVSNLRHCGVEADEVEDGFDVVGGEFKGGVCESYGDHRIAMSFALVGLLSPVCIRNSACIDVSFPNFLELLARVTTIYHEDHSS